LAYILLSETICAKRHNLESLESLDHAEWEWVNDILKQSYPLKNHTGNLGSMKQTLQFGDNNKPKQFSFFMEYWKEVHGRQEWGIIYDLNGEEISNCAWGLGHTSNNQEESVAVYMGLKFLTINSRDDIAVIEDSELIIK
jgi:hypothetical protein